MEVAISNINPSFHPLPNIPHKRVYVKPWTLDHKYNYLVDNKTTFIDGVDSIFVYSEKKKYINIEACVKWPDLDNNFILMLPGEIARTELERAFGTPDIAVSKSELELLDVPPPNYYDGEIRRGKLWYCDLVGAYNQIYEFLTLDCRYPGGQGELSLRFPSQVLRTNKLARNSLIGISRCHSVDVVKGNKFSSNPFRNPYFNPNLWRQLQAILHELAQTAIEMGAFYIATDGYLFQDKKAFEAFTELLNELGLSYKAHWGGGYCTGWCSYSVPGKKTKIYREDTGQLNNIVVERGALKWWSKAKKSLLSQ